MRTILSKSFISILLIVGFLTFSAGNVGAQPPCPSPVNVSTSNLLDAGDISNKALPGYTGTGTGRGEPCQHGTTLAFYISVFWDTVFILAGLAFLGYLLFGGFRWLTAGGDTKATGDARNIILHALVGLTIIASSFIVIRIIESVFGIILISGPIVFPTPF